MECMVCWIVGEVGIYIVDEIIFELFEGIYWLISGFVLIGCCEERRVEGR